MIKWNQSGPKGLQFILKDIHTRFGLWVQVEFLRIFEQETIVRETNRDR
jgi:hypothetical protein